MEGGEGRERIIRCEKESSMFYMYVCIIYKDSTMKPSSLCSRQTGRERRYGNVIDGVNLFK
jgi:hypothetical protein